MSSNASALLNLLSVAQVTGLGGYLDGSITTPAPAPTPATAVPAPAPATASVTPVLAATPINSQNPSPEEWEL
ncbi:hypothetical protein GYMLUDRAFT_247581 [Collybiopsis luxurians FD-317 M1]|uniref:Uncharacterized protein n=1 Tax=Collybiopsis luxurians FD-317 M1 TaxID=944289 RepID=A0A0D0CFC8_9AGAR|nr:hypothetical protein GYMLUDRAFT_247581 [Collybiopsis luxurians FD-317 M1]